MIAHTKGFWVGFGNSGFYPPSPHLPRMSIST